MKLQIIFYTGLLIGQFCFGQPMQKDSVEVNELSEVRVITGTRTSRLLASLPLPMAVITSEEIAKTGITRLNEILSEQTGIILIADESGFEGIQIQGLDAAYTLILLDGVPIVGRNAGVLDLSRIAVGNIDRIEIVKGASSALYGSEAMGGVINVITKKPKSDMLSGNFSYRYATFDTNDLNANLLWKKNRFSANVFANFYSSDGFDLDKTTVLKNVEKFYNYTINPKFYYDFSEKVKLIVSNRFYNQKMNNVALIEREYYKGDAEEKEWNSQVKVAHQLHSNFYFEYELYTTNYKNNSFLEDESQVLYNRSFYNQWLFRPEIRATFSINQNKLTAGIGINQETLNRTYINAIVKFNSQYVFVQYDYNPNQKWNILAGFRYDNHSEYASQLSPKLAFNYKINNNFSLKTAVGYGYKAPDFRQLYFDFTNPSVGYTVLGYNVAKARLDEMQDQILKRQSGINFDEPLQAESAVNFNFGTFYKKEKFKVEVNAFYNSIHNLIDTRAFAQKNNGQNLFSYFNTNAVFTYGLELNSNYNFTKNVMISFGYQYLTAKDKSISENFEDHQYIRNAELQTIKIDVSDYFGLYNRSKHTANFKLLYTISTLKTAVNLRLFYRSKYGIFDTNGNQILDKYDTFVADYFITNLSASKYITDSLLFQIGATNLLDYKEPNQIPNLSGRQLFARIQFNF